VIDKRLVTLAVATLLQTATGRPVGRGKMPKADPPYYLLYSVDTALSGAPLADESEDASFVYQVTSVSGPDPAVANSTGTLDQAEWLADKARRAVLQRDPDTGLWLNPLIVPGYTNHCRELDIEPGGTSDPTDGIISYVQRFRFDLTPA
jgi:hypothetical protein